MLSPCSANKPNLGKAISPQLTPRTNIDYSLEARWQTHTHSNLISLSVPERALICFHVSFLAAATAAAAALWSTLNNSLIIGGIQTIFGSYIP